MNIYIQHISSQLFHAAFVSSMVDRSNFLVNSADRVIRVFDIDVIMASYEDEEPEALQRLQDLVNRSPSPPSPTTPSLSHHISVCHLPPPCFPAGHSGRNAPFLEMGSL